VGGTVGEGGAVELSAGSAEEDSLAEGKGGADGEGGAGELELPAGRAEGGSIAEGVGCADGDGGAGKLEGDALVAGQSGRAGVASRDAFTRAPSSSS